jgi:hypothetical protein
MIHDLITAILAAFTAILASEVLTRIWEYFWGHRLEPMTKKPVKRYTVDGKLMTPTICGDCVTTCPIKK